MTAPLPTAALTHTVRDYRDLAWAVLSPSAGQRITTWARRHLHVDQGAPYDPRRGAITERALRIVQARLTTAPDVALPGAETTEEVYLIYGAQIAKTTFLMTVLLYCMANAPRSVGLYVARQKDLAKFRARFRRAVEHTAPTNRLLPRGVAARDEALAQAVWTVGTTLLLWLCGSLYDDLRSDSLPLALADEFDRFALASNEGSAMGHIRVRQRRYRATRLVIGTTTPSTVTGPGWAALTSGPHDRLLIACPHCGAHRWPDWRRIVLSTGEALEAVDPDRIVREHLARWACDCGGTMDAIAFHHAMRDSIAAGRWCPGTWAVSPAHPDGAWTPSPAAQFDEHGRLVALPVAIGVRYAQHASSLCSLDETLDTFARGLSAAKRGKAEDWVTWLNNEAAEPAIFVSSDDTLGTEVRRQRDAGGFAVGTLDADVDHLVLMFDQQGNHWPAAWFPWAVFALRAPRTGEPGPAAPTVWLVAAGKAETHAQRDAIEAMTWRINGADRLADTVWMDSANGNCRFDIGLWAAADTARRFLLRGDPKVPWDVPWIESNNDPGKRRNRSPRPAGVREWRLQAHHWRNDLWDRLRRLATAAPLHWARGLPDYVIESHTAEHQVTEKRLLTGVGLKDVVVWTPRPVANVQGKVTYRTDNHWWDLSADVLAVGSILGLDQPVAPAPTPGPDLSAAIERLDAPPTEYRGW